MKMKDGSLCARWMSIHFAQRIMAPPSRAIDDKMKLSNQ